MCCLTPSRSGGAGCPLLRPQPPHASACRGERPCWWEQAQGLNSPEGEPLSSDRLRRRPRRGPQVCSCWGSRHDRDGLTALTPETPSTAAEGLERSRADDRGKRLVGADLLYVVDLGLAGIHLDPIFEQVFVKVGGEGHVAGFGCAMGFDNAASAFVDRSLHVHPEPA